MSMIMSMRIGFIPNASADIRARLISSGKTVQPSSAMVGDEEISGYCFYPLDENESDLERLLNIPRGSVSFRRTSNDSLTMIQIVNSATVRRARQIREAGPDSLSDQACERMAGEPPPPRGDTESRTRFVAICSKNNNSLRNSLIKKKKILQDRADEICQNYTKALQDLDEVSLRLEVLGAHPELDAQEFTNQYDMLVKSPLIKRITVDGDRIIVFTKTMYAIEKEQGTMRMLSVRRIGEFKIQIPITITDSHERVRTDIFDVGLIRFENLTCPLDGGQQAPHVFPAGKACFGTYEQTVRELWLARNFCKLILELLHFLINSHNPGDGLGKHIVEWPVAKESEYNGKLAPI